MAFVCCRASGGHGALPIPAAEKVTGVNAAPYLTATGHVEIL